MKTSKTLVVLVFLALVGCTRTRPDNQLHVDSADPCDRPSLVGVMGNKEYALNMENPHFKRPNVIREAELHGRRPPALMYPAATGSISRSTVVVAYSAWAQTFNNTPQVLSAEIMEGARVFEVFADQTGVETVSVRIRSPVMLHSFWRFLFQRLAAYGGSGNRVSAGSPIYGHNRLA